MRYIYRTVIRYEHKISEFPGLVDRACLKMHWHDAQVEFQVLTVDKQDFKSIKAHIENVLAPLRKKPNLNEFLGTEDATAENFITTVLDRLKLHDNGTWVRVHMQVMETRKYGVVEERTFLV